MTFDSSTYRLSKGTMSEVTYKLSLRGKIIGEYSKGELVKKVCDGTISPRGYYYWSPGMKDWAPFKDLLAALEADLRAEKVRVARQRYAEQQQKRVDDEAKAQAEFEQKNTYRFFRNDREYARFSITQLKAKWPEEALPSDMCQRIGDSQWKPAWQLQNDVSAFVLPTKPRRTLASNTHAGLRGKGSLNPEEGAKPWMIWASVFLMIGLLVTMLAGGSSSGPRVKGPLSDAEAISVAESFYTKYKGCDRGAVKGHSVARPQSDVYEVRGAASLYGSSHKVRWRVTFMITPDGAGKAAIEDDDG